MLYIWELAIQVVFMTWMTWGYYHRGFKTKIQENNNFMYSKWFDLSCSIERKLPLNLYYAWENKISELKNITSKMQWWASTLKFCMNGRPSVYTFNKSISLSFFFLFNAAPTACGSSLARGKIGAADAGLYHNYSNSWSELHLQPTAMPDV